MCKDLDGAYYVDYLGAGVQEEFNDPEFEYIEYLENVRDIIKSNILNKTAGIAIKYGWLLSKHNENVDRISHYLTQKG